ncbi:MAG: roadblock/LC7 domain-containing protein [Promethearchaeota archaeon]
MIGGKALKDTLKRLEAHEGVRGVIITNMEGLPIKSTLGAEKTEIIAALITSLIGKAKRVVDELGEELGANSMNFLTISTPESEIMVAPEEDYILILLKST